jgi:hypothetical protein
MTPTDSSTPVDVSEAALLQQLADEHTLLDDVSASSETEFALQTRLRKLYPPDLVRLALLTAELRRKGRTKFDRADQMWFDRVGLEQATPEAVARHKAARFAQIRAASGEAVVDLCSGMGGDTLALASGGPVVSVDLNPAALWRSGRNAAVYAVSNQVQSEQSDAIAWWQAHRDTSRLWHIDPDRRAKAPSRAMRVEDYEPGLDFLRTLIAQSQGGAIKLSPASNFTEKFPGSEIELISLSGEAKEATVWFGALCREGPYRATVLPSGETIAGHPLDFSASRAPLGKILYDPDPAVVRAGLVDAVAERLALSRLDEAEEYLTGDALVASGFVTPFRVLAELPNNERQLRGYFREHPAGQVEIKCRHIPIKAELVRKQLPLGDGPPRVVLFARLEGKARIIIAERL